MCKCYGAITNASTSPLLHVTPMLSNGETRRVTMCLDAACWEDWRDGRSFARIHVPVLTMRHKWQSHLQVPEEQRIHVTKAGMDVWNERRQRADAAPEGGQGHAGCGMTTTRWLAENVRWQEGEAGSFGRTFQKENLFCNDPVRDRTRLTRRLSLLLSRRAPWCTPCCRRAAGGRGASSSAPPPRCLCFPRCPGGQTGDTAPTAKGRGRWPAAGWTAGRRLSSGSPLRPRPGWPDTAPGRWKFLPRRPWGPPSVLAAACSEHTLEGLWNANLLHSDNSIQGGSSGRGRERKAKPALGFNGEMRWSLNKLWSFALK